MRTASATCFKDDTQLGAVSNFVFHEYDNEESRPFTLL